MIRPNEKPQPPDADAALDLLRTQLRIGMERAAAMLSGFLQPRQQFRIRLSAAQAEPPGGPQQAQAGVCLTLEGGVSGAVLLLFSAESACRLAGLLLRQDAPLDLAGASLRSTLKEVGNIFASGVLASLDDRLQLRALPLPPTFLTGSRQELERHWRDSCQAPGAFALQARLECRSAQGVLLEGAVFFQVAAQSLQQIVASGRLTGVAPPPSP